MPPEHLHFNFSAEASIETKTKLKHFRPDAAVCKAVHYEQDSQASWCLLKNPWAEFSANAKEGSSQCQRGETA